MGLEFVDRFFFWIGSEVLIELLALSQEKMSSVRRRTVHGVRVAAKGQYIRHVFHDAWNSATNIKIEDKIRGL